MDETLALDEAITQAKMTVISLVEASRKLRAERAEREAYIAELETRIGQVTPERIAMALVAGKGNGRPAGARA